MIKNHGIPLMMEEQAFKALSNSTYEGKEVSNYVTQYSDNTVVLGIRGPLMKKGSFWDVFFGVSAYDSITKELKTLLKNKDVENIILDIDSPGGMVNGCGELADLIFKAREQKNIISYVSGIGCSAAYYLASAASKVYAHKSATVGSIGVIASFVINKDENTKEINIVSSKSKDKLTDIETTEGRKKVQSDVDTQADIFMNDISRYRDISLETIENTKGGTFIGKLALEMKLVDGISELQTILEELEMNDKSKIQAVESEAKVEAVEKASAPSVDVNAIAKRAADITAKACELNLQGLGSTLVNSSMDTTQALATLTAASEDFSAKAEKETPAVASTDFDKVMGKIENPEVGAKAETKENDYTAEVNSYFQS